MVLSYGILAASLVALLLIQQLISRWQFNRRYKLPPVVPGWPLLGNALDMPFPGGMWGVKMAKKYGEMYTCYFGGKPYVFINSSRVVNDLMEKRASIYSSRPYRPMTQEIMSGGARMLLMSHNDRWRNQRKIMHSILNGKSAEKTFVPYQELEAKQLAYDYLNNSDNFHVCNQRFSNSVITSVVFGRRSGLHDPQLKEILDLVEILGQYLFHPLKNIPDVFPWLHNLPKPLQWWRKGAEEYFIKARALYKKEFDAFEVKLENGTARPCFAADLVDGAAKKEYTVDETEKLFIFSTLLEAGSDTSRNAITQSIAAMATYPAWVKKARSLLDEVYGADAERFPSLADRSKLPYITAAVKETLRWRPFIQTGVPHMLAQDDEYEGYKFPAGTQFAWNAYAIALSEDEYEDPMKFEPDRFMNADLNNPLKGHWQFGAGRRVCVGYNVGMNNIWIAIACLIYCFDVTEDPDHPIDTLNTVWDVHKDAPFKAKIKPRSQAHIELINRISAEALAADY